MHVRVCMCVYTYARTCEHVSTCCSDWMFEYTIPYLCVVRATRPCPYDVVRVLENFTSNSPGSSFSPRCDVDSLRRSCMSRHEWINPSTVSLVSTNNKIHNNYNIHTIDYTSSIN